MASTNFEIQDAQRLLAESGELAQVNQNILRVQEQLNDCSSQIRGAWQSDTEDKESYLGNLDKNLQKIITLCGAVRSLSAKLNSFAEQSIRQANNS